MSNNRIALIDFGAQYKQLIRRKLIEQGAEVDVFSHSGIKSKKLIDYNGIVLSGGPKSIWRNGAPRTDAGILNLGMPVLAICYGLQWANDELGGRVDRLHAKEYGEIDIVSTRNSGLLKGLEGTIHRVLMSHGDSLTVLAPGLEVIAHSKHPLTGETIPAYVCDPKRNFHGVQFHPEVEITEDGTSMFANFVDICGIEKPELKESLTFRNYRDELGLTIQRIREEVGDKKVIMGLSGGVDSTVAAYLLNHALTPDQVIFVHFDTGLNRTNESQNVMARLKAEGIKVECVDISEQVFNSTTEVRCNLRDGETFRQKGTRSLSLSRTIHPQLKRWAFTEAYTSAFADIMRRYGLTPENCYIGQGTLHTDAIESGKTSESKLADIIKSHHNVGGPLDNYLTINPNILWHKDEARTVGRIIGVPEDIVRRQPFPGPGLSVRIVCSDGQNVRRMSEDDQTLYGQLEEKAQSIAANYDYRVLLTPIRTVGVAGDERDYSHLAVLLPNKAWTEMTASDWQNAKRVANAIPMYAYATVNGKEEGISRVLISCRPDIETTQMDLTPTYVNPKTVSELQKGVHAVEKLATEMGLDTKIAQFPVSLLPLSFGVNNTRSLSLRPFITNDWMTGRPAVPGDDTLPLEYIRRVLPVLNELRYSNILFDLSSKPKGTTELE